MSELTQSRKVELLINAAEAMREVNAELDDIRKPERKLNAATMLSRDLNASFPELAGNTFTLVGCLWMQAESVYEVKTRIQNVSLGQGNVEEFVPFVDYRRLNNGQREAGYAVGLQFFTGLQVIEETIRKVWISNPFILDVREPFSVGATVEEENNLADFDFMFAQELWQELISSDQFLQASKKGQVQMMEDYADVLRALWCPRERRLRLLARRFQQVVFNEGKLRYKKFETNEVVQARFIDYRISDCVYGFTGRKKCTAPVMVVEPEVSGTHTFHEDTPLEVPLIQDIEFEIVDG